MNFSDVIIIITVLVVAILVGLFIFNKKNMRKMIQSQEFIEQNRMTTQIFVIDKKQEKPSATNLPKAIYEQLPKSAKMRKSNLVRAKVGPQIVTLMCDKPIYNVLSVKKTTKVDIAGIYIVSIAGMNLENKKNKTISEKLSTSVSRNMSKIKK